MILNTIPVYVSWKIQRIPHASICIDIPNIWMRSTPKRGMNFPMLEAVNAPAIPQIPSNPTISLPTKNGASFMRNARQPHRPRSEPNANAERTEYSKALGYFFIRVRMLFKSEAKLPL